MDIPVSDLFYVFKPLVGLGLGIGCMLVGRFVAKARGRDERPVVYAGFGIAFIICLAMLLDSLSDIK